MKQLVTAKAPINIALCKYWGKKDLKTVLPFTDSVSITLDNFYTETTIKRNQSEGFIYILNGDKLYNEEYNKVVRFCRLFIKSIDQLDITIESTNYGPTNAGLASSASGFAALAVAMNEFFETNYDLHKLTELTRQGSGSAARSLLDGFVLWQTDGYIKKLCNVPNNIIMIAVVIDSSSKHTSSRKAMEIGVNTSPNYQEFIVENQKIANQMTHSICQFDLANIGCLMEKSTALMHQVMKTSNPPIEYQLPQSIELLELVKYWRSLGIEAFTTMDAGPNVKILTNSENLHQVIRNLENNNYHNYHILQAGERAKVIYYE